MTEHIQLIELNEIKNIRITCRKCNISLKMALEDYDIVKKCPRCGEEFGSLYDAFLDMKNALRIRSANDKFTVQIELPEEEK